MPLTLMGMKDWYYDILNFFFPLYCPVCNTPLSHRNEIICLKCEMHLPRTDYSRDADNQLFVRLGFYSLGGSAG